MEHHPAVAGIARIWISRALVAPFDLDAFQIAFLRNSWCTFDVLEM